MNHNKHSFHLQLKQYCRIRRDSIERNLQAIQQEHYRPNLVQSHNNLVQLCKFHYGDTRTLHSKFQHHSSFHHLQQVYTLILLLGNILPLVNIQLKDRTRRVHWVSHSTLGRFPTWYRRVGMGLEVGSPIHLLRIVGRGHTRSVQHHNILFQVQVILR